jgi:hypothetical protein
MIWLGFRENGRLVGPHKWFYAPNWYYGKWQQGFWGPDWAHGAHYLGVNHGQVSFGAFLIIMPIFTAIMAAICIAIGSAIEAHQKWLSQFTSGQQAAIRKAERTAAWGAMAVGSVALHEHNKRVSARLSASVIGGPVPPPSTGNWAMHQTRPSQAGSFGPQPKMWQQP